MKRCLGVVVAMTLIAGQALAGMAEVIAARATQKADGYMIEVTVSHADEGWEHYADAWRVVLPDGKVVATRTLFHPHVEEQPFTRSLSGVVLPAGTTRVGIQPHDSVHGWGETFELVLD